MGRLSSAVSIYRDDPSEAESQKEMSRFSTSEVSDSSVQEKKRSFAFLRTKRFWLILIHGQILSFVIVCTNTMTTIMTEEGNAIPAFQTLFVYNLLFLIFTPYTIYKLGFKGWGQLLLRDSWRFLPLGFIDVQGNYFVVKAYQYTNLLSAALLNNFAIVVVVVLSFVFLKVRYHWSQYIGVLAAVGGMALLVVSDRLTGKDWSAVNPVKGDLFVLLGATCYGISNTWEEYFVSKRPLYVVLGQLGMWASIVNGVQCSIFERHTIRDANWTPKVGGALTGYTLAMMLLYTTAPLLFRMSSAAFYNISLLTSNFWSLLIGVRVFGYHVFWLYPVGFSLTVVGITVYCAAPMTSFGESFKPWLGKDQMHGIAGVGTARARIERGPRGVLSLDDPQPPAPAAPMEPRVV